MPTFDHPSADLMFLSPMSGARAEELAAYLAGASDGARSSGPILDIGCGWGEFLLRAVDGRPEATGLGIDVDPYAISLARERAHERGITERVKFIESRAVDYLPEQAGAISCIGSSHALQPDDAETCQYADVLGRLRGLLGRGGRLVYGESIWSQSPTPGAMAALGGRPDEFTSLPELISIASEAGFAVAGWSEATLAEWDAFESGFGAGYATWLATHESDHPEAEAVRERARAQQSRYLAGYRGVLGLAYLRLVAV